MKQLVLAVLCATTVGAWSAVGSATQDACSPDVAKIVAVTLAERMQYNVAKCHQERLYNDTARCDCAFQSQKAVDGWFHDYYEIVSGCMERQANNDAEFFTHIKIYVNAKSCEVMSTPVWDSVGRSFEHAQNKTWEPINTEIQALPSEADPALCANPGYCEPHGG
jgi:hypothetical protein